MVDIYVGPTEAHYRIHKQMLCRKIPYFDKMLNSPWKEAMTHSAQFPEDSAESMDLLLDWVYTNRIRQLMKLPGTNDFNWDVMEFYSLAEKLCLPELMDAIIDTYRAHHIKHGEVMTWARILKSYEFTSEGSGLRLYALRSMMCIFSGEMDKASEQSWSLSDLQEILEANEDLHRDFLEQVKKKFLTTMIGDVRRDHACDFHCHEESPVCPWKDN